jgi:hypothetical protein
MASDDLYARMKQTAEEFVDSYKQDRCGKDITALSSTKTPKCKHHFQPATLFAVAPNLAAGRTTSEYEAQILHEITEVFKSWKVATNSVIVDERAKKAVVHSTHTMHTGSDGDGKTYAFEFMFTLHMTENGSKVTKVEQYIDTALAGQLMQDQKAIAEAHQK